MTENNENNENNLSLIGFMFDLNYEKKIKEIKFLINFQEISFYFNLIDEDPGHKQSGQYLWPAAIFLCNYLINNWDKYKSLFIIELGAGVGISGIVCSYLNQFISSSTSSTSSTSSVSSVNLLETREISLNSKVILTDYDPGCINLLNDNIIQNNCQNVCKTEYLKWGESINHLEINNQLENILIIGSDLLYCTGVVEPLFTTVFQLLNSINSKNGIFLLASSFDVGEVRISFIITYSYYIILYYTIQLLFT